MKGESAPPWLELLLSTEFFTACTIHLHSPRNECNLFCIDCETPQAAFCYYCRSCHHSSHHVIQIRRSSYHDVVKVSELEDILDISNVQTYVINSARVVFLNERPQLRGCGASAIKSSSSSSSSYNCETCSRVLLDAFRFCSLGCNLTGMKRDDGIVVAENGIACNDKDIDNGGNNGTTNTSCNGKDIEIGEINGTTTNNASEDEICSGASEDKEMPSSTRVVRRHRRKGIPRRAPFF
ncbi:protein RGF1 INDUCIBLE TRANSCRIPTION FACTOR 1-like [Oryza brachyantha]|uniref:B box-type domain-containing protein n=1 Tax=Oryza brachyantha TaxID=4533 RepID=J3L0H8_ORYBR|nr:protein RGF1 INDUCIBLE TRANSCRIPTION FACTOR 1-like [Oryza brachyantha]